MPRVAATAEELNGKVVELNEEIAKLESMKDHTEYEDGKEFFSKLISEKQETRDSLESRLSNKIADQLNEKYSDSVKAAFGTITIETVDPSIPGFAPKDVQSRIEELEMQQLEIADNLTVLRHAYGVIATLPPEDVAAIPRFRPIVDGKSVTMTVARQVTTTRKRRPEIIISVGKGLKKFKDLMINAQVNGTKMVSGPLHYGSWASLAKKIREDGGIDDKSWEAANALREDGKNRVMGFREFMVGHFELEVNTLSDAEVEDDDGDGDED